jgi:1,4-alpha-glucan branching enzyme
LYRAEPGLWEGDYDMDGFYWLDCSDHENSVMSFVRQDPGRSSVLLVVINLTPVLRHHYRLGLPGAGYWREVLNSDSETYGGGNHGNLGGIRALPVKSHNQPWSAELLLPPMSIMIFKAVGEESVNPG